MLIRCPKCGFQQPTDKYCAQCGVDIENFKPEGASSVKKFFTSPLVHLAVLVALSATLGISFYQQRKISETKEAPLTARILQVNSAPADSIAATAEPMSVANDQTMTESQEASTFTSDTPSPATTGATPTAAESGTTTEANQASSAPTPTKSPGIPHLTIYYAEVSRNEIQNLFEQSQTTGQFMSFGDYTAGIIPALEKRITPSNLNIKVLHREERSIEAKTPLRLSYGRGNAGLEVFIEPTELDAQSFRGNMEVRRNWTELGANQAPEPSRKAFPASIELTSAAGFFISGILPRKTPVDNDNEITNINVFRILRSPAFQRGDSEFVIFIDFDRNN